MAKKEAACTAKEMCVVTSKVKAAIKAKGLLTSGEFPAALNCKVYCLLESAVKRAAANGRKTVKPQDL